MSTISSTAAAAAVLLGAAAVRNSSSSRKGSPQKSSAQPHHHHRRRHRRRRQLSVRCLHFCLPACLPLVAPAATQNALIIAVCLPVCLPAWLPHAARSPAPGAALARPLPVRRCCCLTVVIQCSAAQRSAVQCVQDRATTLARSQPQGQDRQREQAPARQPARQYLHTAWRALPAAPSRQSLVIRARAPAATCAEQAARRVFLVGVVLLGGLPASGCAGGARPSAVAGALAARARCRRLFWLYPRPLARVTRRRRRRRYTHTTLHTAHTASLEAKQGPGWWWWWCCLGTGPAQDARVTARCPIKAAGAPVPARLQGSAAKMPLFSPVKAAALLRFPPLPPPIFFLSLSSLQVLLPPPLGCPRHPINQNIN